MTATDLNPGVPRSPGPPPVRPAPPVTNGRLAAALLALARAEEPGSRPASEYRAAATALRELDEDLHGRRVALRNLPNVSPRAADAIGSFLSSGSDDSIDDHLASILDHHDPDDERKRDYLTVADVSRILASGAGPSTSDLRGDVHLHTDRSDGKMTLVELHRVLQARGDAYAFLTDHARDCAVAGGLFAGDFEAERREIDRLNARTERGFTMFLGAESNIAEDGTLDVTPKRVPCLDAVIASVHTNLRDPRDQTPRLMRALEQPGVAVLGHPRGRLYEMRSGIRADWPRVFARARDLGIAIEINGCPERLDLNPRLARQAAESGCLFSLSSDAHARRHLDFLPFALAVARLAGIPAERIVNTWATDRFASWLEERRG